MLGSHTWWSFHHEFDTLWKAAKIKHCPPSKLSLSPRLLERSSCSSTWKWEDYSSWEVVWRTTESMMSIRIIHWRDHCEKRKALNKGAKYKYQEEFLLTWKAFCVSMIIRTNFSNSWRTRYVPGIVFFFNSIVSFLTDFKRRTIHGFITNIYIHFI